MTLKYEEREVVKGKIESLLAVHNSDAEEAIEILASLIYNGPHNRYQHKCKAWARVEEAYADLKKALENAADSEEGMTQLDIEERKADQYA
jgi:hypothetical protein